MGVGRVIKVVMALGISIFLMGFTLPEYRDGQSLLDEQSLLVDSTRKSLDEFYTEYLTSSGVKVITVLDTTVETNQLGNALDGMASSWQLSRSVLLLINPTTKVMNYKVTQDIALELGDIGANIDRLREHVEAGLVDEGLVDFYQKFPKDRVAYGEATTGDGVYGSQQLAEPLTPSQSFFDNLTIIDWVSLGVFGLVIVGGLGYAFYNMLLIRALEKDIQIFNGYLVQNPDHSRKDIWEQLLYDEVIKHSYSDYKEYMANRAISK